MKGCCTSKYNRIQTSEQKAPASRYCEDVVRRCSGSHVCLIKQASRAGQSVGLCMHDCQPEKSHSSSRLNPQGSFAVHSLHSPRHVKQYLLPDLIFQSLLLSMLHDISF